MPAKYKVALDVSRQFDKISSAQRNAMTIVAHEIEREVRLNCTDNVYHNPPQRPPPAYQRTGRLLDSIRAKSIAGANPRIEVSMVHYGEYVDGGTRHVAARPFFSNELRQKSYWIGRIRRLVREEQLRETLPLTRKRRR
jgi:hypothetical protein